jgi:steroid delta-isomerase-like uncharacterized protein
MGHSPHGFSLAQAAGSWTKFNPQLEQNIMSDSNDLKALVRRFHAIMDAGDWDQMRKLVSPAIRARVGGQDLEYAAYLGMGQAFMAAFPDGAHDLKEQIVVGDQVITKIVWRGTHKGDFQGIPATGRSIAIDLVKIDRWVDGRLTEHYAQFDSLGLMQQLGVLGGADAA